MTAVWQKLHLAACGELVVLVDEYGKEIGTAAKASVHHEATPLHLAFSCYLFDGDGRVLLPDEPCRSGHGPGCGPTLSAVTPRLASALSMRYTAVAGRNSV